MSLHRVEMKKVTRNISKIDTKLFKITFMLIQQLIYTLILTFLHFSTFQVSLNWLKPKI